MSQWTQQTIRQPNIGAVLFRRSARARRLSITIGPEGQVRLTMPWRLSLDEARRFLESKSKWIQKHLDQIRRRADRPRPSMTDADLTAAQHRMLHRLGELAAAHGFCYHRVTIRCQKTKWASCSGQNNISLNVNLIFLPPHLLDYVLLHELVHTHHKNHGRHFWTELDRLCQGKAKALQKELRAHSMQIV